MFSRFHVLSGSGALLPPAGVAAADMILCVCVSAGWCLSSLCFPSLLGGLTRPLPPPPGLLLFNQLIVSCLSSDWLFPPLWGTLLSLSHTDLCLTENFEMSRPSRLWPGCHGNRRVVCVCRLHQGLPVQHLLPQQREPLRHHQRPPRSEQALGEQLRGDEVARPPRSRDALLLRPRRRHAQQERLRRGCVEGEHPARCSLLTA